MQTKYTHTHTPIQCSRRAKWFSGYFFFCINWKKKKLVFLWFFVSVIHAVTYMSIVRNVLVCFFLFYYFALAGMSGGASYQKIQHRM